MLEDKQSPPKPKRQQPKVTPKKYPIKNTGAIPKRRGQKLQFSQDTLDVSLEPRVHEQPRDELLLSQQGQPTPEDLLYLSPEELALEFPNFEQQEEHDSEDHIPNLSQEEETPAVSFTSF